MPQRPMPQGGCCKGEVETQGWSVSWGAETEPLAAWEDLGEKKLGLVGANVSLTVGSFQSDWFQMWFSWGQAIYSDFTGNDGLSQ